MSYSAIVTAAGTVRGGGGTPNVVFVAPGDYTALELQIDANDRPLIQPDPLAGPSASVGGLTIWSSPALTAGTIARVIARIDAAVGDPDGLCKITGTS